MNFFENQDIARRKTGRLIVLFIVAVVMIVAAVNLAAYGIMRAGAGYERARRDARPVLRGDLKYPDRFSEEIFIWREPAPYIGVTLVTLGIIVCGSLYKTAALSRGGPAVAEMMGARPLHPGNPAERTLQNVVEEMSIASGVPVPQIYVMDEEPGINAFAAGFTQSDAVVAVTRGCIEKLSRDELQGVVAHEFSHILNGDMRLNLRLIGILHGILVIGLIGWGLIRAMSYSRPRRDDKGGGGMIAILAAGVALFIIGYVGLFFGRLIQAAVSRQREYLADASAVQFTRNPSGLAGALKKIAQGASGSTVATAHAAEVAHMFFASGVRIGLTNLMATHPPIVERIRALDPTFQGDISIATDVLDVTAASQQGAALASMLAGATRQPTRAVRAPAVQVVDRIGNPTPQAMIAAAEALASLPQDVARAAREPFGARVVALALLLSDDASVRDEQLSKLRSAIDGATIEEALKMLPAIQSLGRAAHIALVDLIQPSLRQMSAAQLRQFAGAAQALIEADGRVTLFEYAIYRSLRRHLAAAAGNAPAPKYLSLAPLHQEIRTALTALALSGNSRSNAPRVVAAGLARLGLENAEAVAEKPGIAAIDTALDRLADASPAVKRRIIDAAAHVVCEDGIVREDEAELLRAVCSALDVPVPML